MADVYSDPAWDWAIAERDAEITRLKEEVERLQSIITAADRGSPIYKAIERTLDEKSAWIARPNHDVTQAVALTAGIAWSIHYPQEVVEQNLSLQLDNHRLREEVERLVQSRNRWGQKYNKLLSAVRTEHAYGVYTEARDEYRRVITEQASEIERLRTDVRLAVMSDSKECTAISEVNASLRAEVERMTKALTISAASLVAAIRLLKRAGKKGAPSDKMFAMMLADYNKALDEARAALTSQEPRT